MSTAVRAVISLVCVTMGAGIVGFLLGDGLKGVWFGLGLAFAMWIATEVIAEGVTHGIKKSGLREAIRDDIREALEDNKS